MHSVSQKTKPHSFCHNFIKCDRCSKSFYWHTLQELCNNVAIKYPALPQTRCYTTS